MHFPFNNKRRHLDCDKVNPGAHDKGSWCIIRLLSLLVVRSCALLAGVGSVSNRVLYCAKVVATAKQNERRRGEGIRCFLFPPSPLFSFLASFSLSSSQHSRRTSAETLATQGYSFFFLLSSIFSHTILWQGVGHYNQTCI